MTFDVIKEIRIGATLVMSFIRSLRRHLAAVKRLHRCIYSTSSFGVFARSENFLQIKIFYGHCLCTKKKHFKNENRADWKCAKFDEWCQVFVLWRRHALLWNSLPQFFRRFLCWMMSNHAILWLASGRRLTVHIFHGFSDLAPINIPRGNKKMFSFAAIERFFLFQVLTNIFLFGPVGRLWGSTAAVGAKWIGKVFKQTENLKIASYN